jgi:hypothetical protein
LNIPDHQIILLQTSRFNSSALTIASLLHALALQSQEAEASDDHKSIALPPHMNGPMLCHNASHHKSHFSDQII